MKIDAIFDIRGKTVITFTIPYNDKVVYKQGDNITCGDKQWCIFDIEKYHQGCFGFTPKYRHHALMITPIDHNDVPCIGDEITLHNG